MVKSSVSISFMEDISVTKISVGDNISLLPPRRILGIVPTEYAWCVLLHECNSMPKANMFAFKYQIRRGIKRSHDLSKPRYKQPKLSSCFFFLIWQAPGW